MTVYRHCKEAVRPTRQSPGLLRFARNDELNYSDIYVAVK